MFRGPESIARRTTMERLGVETVATGDDGVAVAHRDRGAPAPDARRPVAGDLGIEAADDDRPPFPLAWAATPGAGPSESDPRSIGAGRSVLVIDDEPLVRRVLTNMLSMHGYTVVQAEDGRSGLELATGDQVFDAILCDLMMPGLDGVAVHAELVRRRPDLARRMVFVTGGAATDRTRAFIERTDITLLAKPFALDQLLAAIAHLHA